MEVNDYIVESNLDNFIFISITNKLYQNYKLKKGFGTFHSYSFYIRGYLLNSSNLKAIANDLDEIYSELRNVYSLSSTEASKYIVIFFRKSLWNKYHKLVKLMN